MMCSVRMKRAAAMLVAGLLGGCVAEAAWAKKPNVIVVMADDLGIGDVSPTNPNCKIKTPQLQRLADAGHLMHNAGYQTAMIGKWHLGWDWARDGDQIDFTGPVENGPDINGFDSYYGHCGSLDMPPYVWVDSGRITAQPDRVEGVTKNEDRYGWYREGPIGADFHIPEVLPHLFDKSVAYVEERAAEARAGKPFFLYLALPAPHTPIVPVPPFKGASDLNPYADFVMQIDHHMGELRDAVKQAGLEGDTLFVFTGDNGCSPEANFPLLREHGHDPSGSYRGHKADIYEGGHRVPLIMCWPGQIEAGRFTAVAGRTGSQRAKHTRRRAQQRPGNQISS